MTERPLWRQAYDELERVLGPQLDGLVRSAAFQRELARATTVQAGVRRRLGAATGRVWHLVNLPAAADLSRLAAQVGALDREVRRLGWQLDQQARSTPTPASGPVPSPAGHSGSTRAGDHGDDTQPGAAAAARPPRRRTQRPAGP